MVVGLRSRGSPGTIELPDEPSGDRLLAIPWQKPPSKRFRQILLPYGSSGKEVRRLPGALVRLPQSILLSLRPARARPAVRGAIMARRQASWTGPTRKVRSVRWLGILLDLRPRRRSRKMETAAMAVLAGNRPQRPIASRRR
jgi:hypothetical protein